MDGEMLHLLIANASISTSALITNQYPSLYTRTAYGVLDQTTSLETVWQDPQSHEPTLAGRDRRQPGRLLDYVYLGTSLNSLFSTPLS